jgi:DNA-binding transcriptional MerR regulator
MRTRRASPSQVTIWLKLKDLKMTEEEIRKRMDELNEDFAKRAAELEQEREKRMAELEQELNKPTPAQ